MSNSFNSTHFADNGHILSFDLRRLAIVGLLGRDVHGVVLTFGISLEHDRVLHLARHVHRPLIALIILLGSIVDYLGCKVVAPVVRHEWKLAIVTLLLLVHSRDIVQNLAPLLALGQTVAGRGADCRGFPRLASSLRELLPAHVLVTLLRVIVPGQERLVSLSLEVQVALQNIK